MIYYIENQTLKAGISSTGAELKSLVKNGFEYIWQGDKKYWSYSAPIMFPMCGRMFEDSYSVNGKVYPMEKHGFCRGAEFEVTNQGKDFVSFTITANEKLKAIYPFNFTFTVTYKLDGDKLCVLFNVQNLGCKKMYFSVGGHPAFNLPFAKDNKFDDCYVEFSSPCPAKRMEFSPRYLKSGNFPLFDGENLTKVQLHHGIFNKDAIFLKDTAKTVYLKDKSGLGVKLDFADMKYLGIWHPVNTDAPFVCLEPWQGSPALDGEITEITTAEDFICLGRKEQKTLNFTITVL